MNTSTVNIHLTAQLAEDQTYKTWVPTADDGAIIGEQLATRLSEVASEGGVAAFVAGDNLGMAMARGRMHEEARNRIEECACSPKYRELAPGVHAAHCPLAGMPL